MRDYMVTVKTNSGEVTIELRCTGEEAIRRLWGNRVLSITIQ